MAQISIIDYSKLSDYLGRIDAEFYKPISLHADEIIKNSNYKPLGDLVLAGYRVVYENTKILKSEDVKAGIDAQFMQSANISNDGLWIDVNNIGYVDQKDWYKYPKGRIIKGELLIEVKGQAEKVTIVQDYIPERTLITGTLFKLSLKPNTVSHEYIFAFFSSKYGKILRDRTKVNTLIAYVSKPELYRIPVPIPSIEAHNLITNLVADSFKYTALAKSLNQQANSLLVQEFGLDKIHFEKKKSYFASFSEVVNNNRSDADYYQTKYRQLEKHINSIETVSLSSICTFVKGFEVGTPAYTEVGPTFLRVSNLTKEGFAFGNSDKYISEETYKSLKLYQPKSGDILLTKDGTIGTCYVVDEYVEGIISSGIMNLNLFDQKIPKEYLALVINSKLCQMQAERECSGALITHWKPEQIRNLRIPILKKEKMDHLSELCSKSKVARKESKRLLEEAKNRVEQLIEEAANK